MNTRKNWIRRSVLLAFIVLITSPAWCQLGKISGRLMKDGDPLPIAKVKLLDGQNVFLSAVMTDMEGHYEFIGLEPGTYNLVAEDEDGKSEARSISINGSLHIVDINLDLKSKYLCLCVHARYIPVPPFTDLDAERIERMKLDRNVLSMLASLRPGIYQADFGEPLMIRGAREGSTTVIVDGMKLRGKVELPLAAIRDVNFYSSGMPAEFGDATGGVIYISTMAPRTHGANKYGRLPYYY